MSSIWSLIDSLKGAHFPTQRRSWSIYIYTQQGIGTIIGNIKLTISIMIIKFDRYWISIMISDMLCSIVPLHVFSNLAAPICASWFYVVVLFRFLVVQFVCLYVVVVVFVRLYPYVSLLHSYAQKKQTNIHGTKHHAKWRPSFFCELPYWRDWWPKRYPITTWDIPISDDAANSRATGPPPL